MLHIWSTHQELHCSVLREYLNLYPENYTGEEMEVKHPQGCKVFTDILGSKTR